VKMSRWKVAIIIFREAAEKVRNHCFSSETQSLAVQLAQLSGVARAVWSGNIFHARKLAESTEIGAFHVDVSSRFPKLRDPAKFELELASAKQKTP